MSERVPPAIEPISVGMTRGERQLDVTDEPAVHRLVEQLRPDAIIHLAAVSRVEAAAEDPESAGDINAAGAGVVARAAARSGARLLALSSDVVFNGRAAPYDEQSVPDPINAYGASKAAAERSVLRHHPEALVVRTSVLVGRNRSDRFPFSTYIIDRARAGRPIELFDNERRNFFPVTTAAECLWECLVAPLSGILHVASRTSLSRFDASLAVATTGPPDRPSDLTLSVDLATQSLGHHLPTMDEAISEVLADLRLP